MHDSFQHSVVLMSSGGFKMIPSLLRNFCFDAAFANKTFMKNVSGVPAYKSS